MSLIKPSLHTPYHIDFQWWQKTENDWHVHLTGLLCEPLQNPLGAAHEPPLAMTDRNVHAVDALQERTLPRRRLEMHPAVLVVAAVVVRQRRERAVLVGGHQQPRL